MSQPRTRIEIWSDIACPWCYIGERRFFRALDARADREAFEVVFRPFELDPEAPVPGEPLRDRLASRYGARSEAMMRQAGGAAAGEAIAADWERALTARTRTAHRLLVLAAREHGEKTQRRLAELLFAAQFEHGGDVSSVDELTRLAVAAGMDEARVRNLLASNEGEAEVEAKIERPGRLGIHSVPTFVLGDRYAVAGAQSTATFAELLDELVREAAAATAAGVGAEEGADCASGACIATRRTAEIR